MIYSQQAIDEASNVLAIGLYFGALSGARPSRGMALSSKMQTFDSKELGLAELEKLSCLADSVFVINLHFKCQEILLHHLRSGGWIQIWTAPIHYFVSRHNSGRQQSSHPNLPTHETIPFPKYA